MEFAYSLAGLPVANIPSQPEIDAEAPEDQTPTEAENAA
jgi:hypothetical protein